MNYDTIFPAGYEFINDLSTHSQTPPFRKEWNLQIEQSADMNKPMHLSGKLPDIAKAGMEEFVGEIAAKYFKILSMQPKSVDPNHLYLGNSISWMWSKPSVQSYGRFVDVASFDR
jgi:hypothetical protein